MGRGPLAVPASSGVRNGEQARRSSKPGSLSQGFGKSKERNYASGEDIYKVQIIALILHFLAFDLRRRRRSVTERMQARLARTGVIDSVMLSMLTQHGDPLAQAFAVNPEIV